MSSEEFPAVPTRPQRHAGSPSPTPVVPTRPGFKSPPTSLPQVPSKRPTRLKTAEFDELVQNTEDQLSEMEGLIHKHSSDSRSQFQELKTQEDKLQSGIEELFGQPRSNAKEQELKEEKERKWQPLDREEELQMLERRREELIRQRQREKELQRETQEDLKRQEEKELERKREMQREKEVQRARELQRQSELDTERKLHAQEELERQRELEKKRQEEIEVERKRERELAKQRELERQEKKQREMEKQQEEELRIKKRELELLEKERRVAQENVLKSQESRHQDEKQESAQSKGAFLDADSVFLETVGKDFGLGPDEPNTFLRMPERPNKSSVGSKSRDLKSDSLGRSGTPIAGQSANKNEGHKKLDLHFTQGKFESSRTPSVPERPYAGTEKSSLENPITHDRRQSAGQEKPQSSSVPERPSFGIKKSSTEPPFVPDKRPGVVGRKSGSPIVPGRPTLFGRNPSAEFPVVPEKRPDSREQKSGSLTASKEPIREQESSSSLPIVPDRRPDHGNKKSISPILPAVPDKRPDLNVRTSESPPEIAPDDNEQKTVSPDASGEKETGVLESPELGDRKSKTAIMPDNEEFPTPGTSEAPEEQKSDVIKAELPEVDTKEAKLELSGPSDDDKSKPSSMIDRKLQESGSGISSNETAKKKLPPVPKKPSSRIFAFQEMLRKQQMEEAQSSHRTPSEPSAAESNKPSESTKQPFVPQRPNRTPAGEERSKFENNLNGLFALPGMYPMGGGLPLSLAKKLGPASTQEEKKDTTLVPSVRQPRARGPRGRKLPSNVASVKKISSESKTNEIEIFKTWMTVVLKREDPLEENFEESSQKSVSLAENIENLEQEQGETEPVKVADPAQFDLDNQESVELPEAREKLAKYDTFVNAEEHNAPSDEKEYMKMPNFFPSTTEPTPTTTFSFQDTPENSKNNSSIDLTLSANESRDIQPHNTDPALRGPPAESAKSSDSSENFPDGPEDQKQSRNAYHNLQAEASEIDAQ